ncbi:MAG TPA: tetratricopeptide repeat protein [Thermoflexales bacterium]|nr:tetratricopeptide repeat protein [Thermoflexales bacterium]
MPNDPHPHIKNEGSGAVAQGDGATALGERAVLVTGVNNGLIITGDGKTVSLTQVIQMYGDLPSALCQLKSVDEHFTGREEQLNEIIKVVGAGGAAAIAGVQGKGGIGKTALALMAGYALCPAYPDAQVFVELGAFSGSPRTAEQARDDVLRAFYPNAKLPDDQRVLWNEYRAALSGVKNGLMILDDAANDAQVQALRPPPGWGVIITSRHNLSEGNPVPLDVLPEPDAMKLLRAICPRLSEDEATHMAGLCGRLPLALRIAGGFLKVKTTKPAREYLSELSADRLGRLGDAVETVLARSWAALNETERAAWAALSIMPASFTREAGAALLPSLPRVTSRGGVRGGEVLDELAAYNILDYDAATERFVWHDLLRELAAKKLSEAERGAAARRGAAQLRHAAYFTQMAYTANKLYLQGGAGVVNGLAMFDRERAHIESAFDTLRTLKAHRELIELVDAVVYIGQALRFHPRQSMAWLEAQREAAHASGHKQAEGWALGNLGNAYAALGDARRAIEFYKQCLTLHREIGDRRGEGADLGNLGNAYAALGDARWAIEYYEQCLTLHREIGDRRGEGADLGNLGLAYADLGDAQRAIGFYEQRLVIAREIGDRRGEGNALGNLGTAYRNLGDARRAIGFYEQQLEIVREIGDRRGEGAALGNLGSAYHSLGDARRAIGFYEQYLAIAREIGDRRGEGNAIWGLGNCYLNLSDEKTAIQNFEQALKIMTDIGDKGAVASLSWNLGLWYEAQGNLVRAAELMQVRVDFLRGIGHPDADEAAADVAGIRAKLGQ